MSSSLTRQTQIEQLCNVTVLFCLVSVRSFVITRIADVITGFNVYASVLLGLHRIVNGDAARARARAEGRQKFIAAYGGAAFTRTEEC